MSKMEEVVLEEEDHIDITPHHHHHPHKEDSSQSESMCRAVFNSKTLRFILMLIFAVITFIPMIIVAEKSGTLVLISHSYHLLSDMMSFLISIFAISVSRVKKTSSNTFGWARAEVVGSLVNCIFLLALMFAVTVETLKHVIEPTTPTHPELVLAMGILCLTFNTVGLLMFCGYRQHRNTVPSSSQLYLNEMLPPIAEQLTLMVRHTPIELDWHPKNRGILNSGTSSSPPSDQHTDHRTTNGLNGYPLKKRSSTLESGFTADINMRGIFIHLLRDASVSLIICIYSVIILSSEGTWLTYLNPITSLMAIVIITVPTFPLMKEASMILLQTVPDNIDVVNIIDNLYKVASEILGVHEVHVWPLTGARIIATAHIQCRSSDYTMVSQKIKNYFHSIGIHSTTVQPEFVECVALVSPEPEQRDEMSVDVDCLLTCARSCDEMTCCGTTPAKTVRFADDVLSHDNHDHHHDNHDDHHDNHDHRDDNTDYSSNGPVVMVADGEEPILTSIGIDDPDVWSGNPRDSVYSKTSRNSLISYESTV